MEADTKLKTHFCTSLSHSKIIPPQARARSSLNLPVSMCYPVFTISRYDCQYLPFLIVFLVEDSFLNLPSIPLLAYRYATLPRTKVAQLSTDVTLPCRSGHIAYHSRTNNGDNVLPSRNIFNDKVIVFGFFFFFPVGGLRFWRINKIFDMLESVLHLKK